MPELKTEVRPARQQVKELPKQVLYNFENEVLGLYMTGSPLDDYDEISKKYRFDFTTEETSPVQPEGSEEKIYPVVAKRFVTTGGILRGSLGYRRQARNGSGASRSVPPKWSPTVLAEGQRGTFRPTGGPAYSRSRCLPS